MPKAKYKVRGTAYTLPTNQGDVLALKFNGLNWFCKQNDIDVSLPKKARQSLLCLALGISTSGQGCNTQLSIPKDGLLLPRKQLDEYQQLTPHILAKANGWTKSLSNTTTLEVTPIKQYLLGASVITQTEARRYKETRAYAMTDFVQNIYFNILPSSPTFCAVRGQSLPSLGTSNDDIKEMFCILDKITGDPLGGYCTCTAG